MASTESGICLQSIVPVRLEPSHTSPMVTQVLFGELFRVIKKEKNWAYIQLIADHYEGWIPESQAQLIPEPDFIRLTNAEIFLTTNLVHPILKKSDHSDIQIVLGSSLPGFKNNHLQLGPYTYFFDGTVTNGSTTYPSIKTGETAQIRQQLVQSAMKYLNTPYLWGGRTPFGIDCSGFTQMVYKLNRVQLPRDANQQAEQGEMISFLPEAETGDLAFFDDENGNIVHVGMLLDNRNIIHCSGDVHIDLIDHEGIYSNTAKKYTHHLRTIRSMVGEAAPGQ